MKNHFLVFSELPIEVTNYLKKKNKNSVCFYKLLDFEISLPIGSFICYHFPQGQEITTETQSIGFRIKNYSLEFNGEDYEVYCELDCTKTCPKYSEEFGEWLISNCITFEQKFK